MEISKKQDTLLKIIFGIIVSILFVLALSSQAYNQYQIKKYKVKTFGIVKKIVKKASRKSYLYYDYVVEQDTLNGNVGVDFFEVESLRLNCVNKKFIIYYSSKNPNNSMIDLGKFNDFKTTVEFFKAY